MTVDDIRKEVLMNPKGARLAPEDFFLLLAHVTGHERTFLIAHPEYPLSSGELARFYSFVTRRLAHEPLAFLIGRKEFFGFSFSVNHATLVPRPETELLVASASDRIVQKQKNISLPEKKYNTLIDVGTGSGNILLSLIKTLESQVSPSHYRAFGFDISSDALMVARKNARSLMPVIRTRFFVSDILSALSKNTLKHSNHLYIFANLPYLSHKIYQAAPLDVKKYEPSTALVSDQGGLAHIIQLLETLAHIRSTLPALPIDIWLEISPEQPPKLAKHLERILPEARYSFTQDLASKDRFAEISIRPDITV